MINLAVRVRELVSSNIDALIDKASNPTKMLGLLLTEVEENLIQLHGDIAKAEREHARLAARADQAAEDAEGWTAKAKTAVDHGREDLARAALLARETGRKDAAKLAEQTEAAKQNVGEMRAAIARLETKREDIAARICEEVPSAGSAAGTSDKAGTSSDRLDRRMDRLDAIERRVGFGKPGDMSEADIDAEIAALGKDSEIDAEIAAMKAPAKRSRKKAK